MYFASSTIPFRKKMSDDFVYETSPLLVPYHITQVRLFKKLQVDIAMGRSAPRFLDSASIETYTSKGHGSRTCVPALEDAESKVVRHQLMVADCP
jgi:sulfopyruvate decarboxylase TPP-binding subunit